jgi:putative aminopeptidase FrvX
MEVQTTRLLLQNVNIHTKKESLKVFWMASYPYSKRRKEETPKISNLFIDIGCETKKRWIKWAFM